MAAKPTHPPAAQVARHNARTPISSACSDRCRTFRARSAEASDPGDPVARQALAPRRWRLASRALLLGSYPSRFALVAVQGGRGRRVRYLDDFGSELWVCGDGGDGDGGAET